MRIRFADLTLWSSLFVITSLASLPCQAKPDNDDIFPPASAAEKAISFDGLGFTINGKRTFIVSGSVHYARVPRENWRDILLKLKRAGFNTVQTYVFWNYHEDKEGQFDFTTDSRDLGAFLDTAKEVGLYAIVRVGPYVCSEWTNGGYPNWLILEPGMKVRENNPPYIAAVDEWFSKLLPIVASRQIHKGGNVILVQLENEMPTQGWRYWGTSSDGAHMDHLLDLAHQNGLEIPMFFSGLNHGHDPAPKEPIDNSKRKSPWLSTELWTLWFDQYGNDGEDWYAKPPGDKYNMAVGERHIWRVLSQGGNGFNLYMAHGGTTFGFYNFNNEIGHSDPFFGKREKGTACYDFGTLIGQTGNTTTLYDHIKRLGYFADSFSGILAGGTDASSSFKDFASGVNITARTAPEGTLVFMDNDGNGQTVTLKSGSTMKLAPGEIVGLPVNVPLTTGLAIAEADTRILALLRQSGAATVVCYGNSGDTGKIALSSASAGIEGVVTDSRFKLGFGANPSLSFSFPAQGVGEDVIKFGSSVLRVLVLSEETADKTWLVDTAAGRQIIIGPPYLGDFARDSAGKLQFTIDYPWNKATPGQAIVLGNGPSQAINLPAAAPNAVASPDTLPLSDWEISTNDSPLADHFDDGNWFTLPGGSPPEMQQDGEDAPYAWYRVHITSTKDISSLKFDKIADRAAFFVDGKLATTFDMMKQKGYEISLQIPAGDHELAAFVSFSGRRKLDGFTGAPDNWNAARGLRGPVFMNGDTATALTGWKMRGGVNPDALDLSWGSHGTTNGAPAYLRTHFKLDTALEPGAVYRFHPGGLSFGNVWLNGHNLGRYPEVVRDCPGLWLPACWLKAGDNSLVVFDEQGKSPANSKIQLEVGVSRHRITIGSN